MGSGVVPNSSIIVYAWVVGTGNGCTAIFLVVCKGDAIKKTNTPYGKGVAAEPVLASIFEG